MPDLVNPLLGQPYKVARLSFGDARLGQRPDSLGLGVQILRLSMLSGVPRVGVAGVRLNVRQVISV